MTTKPDWPAVPHERTAEERRKLGEPPTTEELMAYSRGQLSAADRARVQSWLDANPEMARALNQPFPDDDAKPGDPDYLSEDELSRRWTALQNEIRPKGRLVRFPALAALAASVAIVFAGLYWQARSDVRALSRPVLLDVTQVVDPENGRRGASGGPHLLNVTEDGAVCILQLSDPSRFQWYRIVIVNAQSEEEVWKSEPSQPQEGGLSVLIPRTFLRPGTYRIKVFGLNETRREEAVDSYLVRVPSR
ncbi:MAG: hypothetical protein ACJ74H_10665 [Thermoanaerobaculia bacterium]